MLLLALASVSLVVTLMGKLASGPSTLEQKRSQLTGASGSESYPAFSPDSKRIAYSAREGAKVSPFHIFVRELGGGAPKQLTQGEDSDVGPAWSPDGGTLAFERIAEGRVEYIVIPADGGPERKVAEFGPAAEAGSRIPGVSWTPDGKSLVVTQTADKQLPTLAVVTIEGGKVQRITNPPEGSEGDSMPAVSPAGDSVAFVRSTNDQGGDIWMCDLKGENARRVTFDDKAILGIAWSRDGQELVYSANREGGWRLWRIAAAGGSPRQIVIAGRQAYYPAMGRNRLAYTDSPTVSSIWRGSIGSDGNLVDERPVIRSTGRERSPVYSPDGTKIVDVSDQTEGDDEIFLQDADGKNRVQLTHRKVGVGFIRWTPDGKQLIFDAGSDHGPEVFLMGAIAGAQPARVLLNARNASMSHNGKWVYFQSRGQIWKATPAGGSPQALTKMQGEQPVESADGKFVIFRSRGSLWRVPADGGEEEEFVVPDHDLFWGTAIQPVKKGVYFLEWERGPRVRNRNVGGRGEIRRFGGGGQMVVSFYDYATKAIMVAVRMRNFEMNGRIDGAFSVSPDGKYILYPKVDRSQTNLMLVENFK
jgi:Tol biopolymer transport system component